MQLTSKKLLIINKLPLAGLVFWPIFAMGSLFMFDAPGSEKSIPTMVLALSIWLYPFTVIPGYIGTKKACKNNMFDDAKKYTILTYSSVILFVLALLVLIGYCDGEFNCG